MSTEHDATRPIPRGLTGADHPTTPLPRAGGGADDPTVVLDTSPAATTEYRTTEPPTAEYRTSEPPTAEYRTSEPPTAEYRTSEPATAQHGPRTGADPSAAGPGAAGSAAGPGAAGETASTRPTTPRTSASAAAGRPSGDQPPTVGAAAHPDGPPAPAGSGTWSGPQVPVSTAMRVGTVVWGLVLAIIGAGVIAVAAGARFDLELVLIGLLALAGVALVAGSVVTSTRRRR